MTRVAALLLVMAMVTGCSDLSRVGIVRVGDHLVLTSSCTDVGIRSASIGLDTGVLESNGVHPVLTETEFEATWIGPDLEASIVLSTAAPDDSYAITGEPPSLAADPALLVEVQLDSAIYVRTTRRVDPARLDDGLVQVLSEDDSTQEIMISTSDFATLQDRCLAPPWPLWLRVLVLVGGLTALVGAGRLVVRSARRPAQDRL